MDTPIRRGPGRPPKPVEHIGMPPIESVQTLRQEKLRAMRQFCDQRRIPFPQTDEGLKVLAWQIAENRSQLITTWRSLGFIDAKVDYRKAKSRAIAWGNMMRARGVELRRYPRERKVIDAKQIEGLQNLAKLAAPA